MAETRLRSSHAEGFVMVAYGADAIAVVGMAGQFPKSPDIASYWHNLLAQADCISDFSKADLLKGGVPETVMNAPGFVPSWGVLPQSDKFDAAFFGYMPKEALLMDPQQRIMLETVWHALEDAEIDPRNVPNPCGVFLGSSENFYFLDQVFRNPRALAPGIIPYGEDRVPPFTTTDYLAARVAYKLNLTGPSLTSRAACASSLISVVNACQMLADFTCDMAVAGGVSVSGRQARGYFGHAEHGMLSPQGRCRSFDAAADGSVFADAVGCVVLRRLDDALEDNCPIHAVLQGWATNNDGADKVGFSAPSVSGQVSVIRQALERAEVPGDQIGAVEAHGSATPVGDAVEIAALASALGQGNAPCIIGAAKSSIGHTNGAAGISGLIKGILQIREGKVAPVVHFQDESPELALDKTRFEIARGVPMAISADAPFSGVSSFGLGGMNAHVILAPPPARPKASPAPLPVAPLMLSAPTEEDLTRQGPPIWDFLSQQPETLPDLARRLSLRGNQFPSRHVATVRMDEPLPKQAISAAVGPGASAKVIFLCSGVGFSPSGLGQTPHDQFPEFRGAFDACADRCQRQFSVDVSYVLHGGEPSDISALHAGMFALEYATAQLYQGKGIQAGAVIGHSLGECIALAVSGAISWQDTLDFICARARLLAKAPEGRMVVVPMAEQQARSFCVPDSHVAALNGPEITVISGTPEAIKKVRAGLAKAGHGAWPLPGDHAMHTPLMQPAAAEIAACFPTDKVKPPPIELTFCDGVERGALTDPTRWQQHVTEPVHWADAIKRCIGQDVAILIELGPGGALTGMTEEALRRNKSGLLTLQSHPMGAPETRPEGPLPVLAALWEQGFELPWRRIWEDLGVLASTQTMPGYAFEPCVYWIDDKTSDASPTAISKKAMPSARGGASRDLGDILQQTWSSYMGHAGIDPEVDFHDLGGTSFLALQICTSLWREHQIDLRVTQLLELGSLTAIKTYLEATTEKEPSPLHLRDEICALFPAQPKNSPLDTITLRKVIPDIIAIVRRHADRPIYPNEIERCVTLSDLQDRIALVAGEVTPPDISFDAKEEPLELPILFVLSPPRSGSTLLRVMLAGHSGLFAPPELHLMAYPNMHDRAQDNDVSDRDQGLIRAFAELCGSVDEAAALVARMNTENWLTIDVYRALQQQAGPRILVDKSPGNTARIDTLERIAALCPKARVINLFRHPYAVIESLIRNRFAALMQGEGLGDQAFAEHIWARSVGNILDSQRLWTDAYNIRFEALVQSPEIAMRQVCDMLGLPFEAAMLTPYEGNRMRDGLGDPNFLTHNAIDPELGQKWQNHVPKQRLGFACRELAGQLDYDVQLRDMPQFSAPSTPSSFSAAAAQISKVVLHATDGAPLIFFPAIDGTVECYRGLARKLKGYSSCGLRIDDLCAGTVSTMVDDMVAKVLESYPPEVVHLVGWSFGGVLALEAGQRLYQRTGVYPKLTVLDTPARRKSRIVTEIEALRLLIAAARDQDPEAPILNGETLQDMMAAARDAKFLPEELFVSEVRRRTRIIHAMMPFAGADMAYGGPVSVLRATQNQTPGGDDLGWRELAQGKVVVGKMPTTHDQMLDAAQTPHLSNLMLKLWADLEVL